VIKQQGGKWHLYGKDGSKHLGGPYDSREEAEDRERQVNYHKHKGDLVEISMVITKASLQPDGSMRWQAVTSDTSPDNTGEATSLALFQDWTQRIDENIATDWLPPPRKPFLGVSHYSDLGGFGEAGITERAWVQGDLFKAAGTFRTETPVGPALFEAVKKESELVRRGEALNQPIRISAAWWDIEHSHGPFIFTRKSLTDVCPMCAKGEGGKVYLKGQLDHFAATRVPINPRTSLALQEKSEMGITRKQDAATIINEDLAEEMEEKSRLVGKSEAESPAIVVKAKKPPVEEEAAEKGEEETEERMEEEKPKKKKPVGGSYMTDKAYTWQAAKALPEAKSLSRVELMGLVRRNIAEQPQEERLGMLEALLDDMNSELNEIKTAVEELYFTQPAVEDDLPVEDYREEEITPMSTDYLDTFAETVTEALTSDQPTPAKAETIQKALNTVALAIKAELETPQGGGDVAQALRAALAPISDQIAQLTARLNMAQQPTMVMPTQKSIAVPSVAQQPQQNQLPVSPITGQPSSITAAVRASTIPY
jgi:hypothetical protein